MYWRLWINLLDNIMCILYQYICIICLYQYMRNHWAFDAMINIQMVYIVHLLWPVLEPILRMNLLCKYGLYSVDFVRVFVKIIERNELIIPTDERTYVHSVAEECASHFVACI
eukprot:421845_1